MTGAAGALLPGLRAAFGLLTRLPIGARAAQPEQLGAAAAFLPLVGGVLGALLLGLRWALPATLSSELTALVLVAALALLTGGLHLDGLADVFDGLGGGHGDRERTLAIMRDPRIGALGATALLLVVLGKLFALMRASDWELALFPLAGRLAAVPLVVFFPCARPDGLAHAFHTHARPLHAGIAFAIAAGAILIAGAGAIAPTLLAIAVAGLLGLWLQRRIGGMTGDVYGAAIELAEVAFLISTTLA